MAQKVKRRSNKNKNKNKKPIPILSPPMKSRKRARQVTTRFHSLTKEIDEVQKSSMKSQDKRQRIQLIEKQIDSIGGRKAYQSASQLSTTFFNTSKWVIGQLNQMGYKPKSIDEPTKILEVGAINTTLLSCKWMEVDAIDLNSTHPDIKEMDFFDLKPEQKYDAVVCSMVLNCVPDPLKRGEMLRRSLLHLKPNGRFFLTLPRLCLNNSKYMTYQLFKELLEVIGFEILTTKDSPKVAFFCCKISSQRSQRQSTLALTPPFSNSRSFLAPPFEINKQKKFKNSFAVCLAKPNKCDGKEDYLKY